MKGDPPGRPRLLLLLIPLLLIATPSMAQVEALPEVRELYYAAVQRSDALGPAASRVRELMARAPAGSDRKATLAAYGGAVETLRAKHGHWPPARLRHMRRGLATLDSIVVAHPGLAEARYLRLMSCYYLPGILGRKWSVREDFAALAELLPGVRGGIPEDLYIAITRFVIENGGLDEARRRPLEALLADAT